MGMSASQARFLSLTARKNNVEFEGQQINQQRTTLSNQSANYYSELCNMTVPTPPSVDDYTKVSYTFDDGALTNTITSMIAKPNNYYSISYVQQWQDDYSIVSASSSMISMSTGKPATKLSAAEIAKLEYYYYDETTGKGSAVRYDENQKSYYTEDKDGNKSYITNINENNLVMYLYDENETDLNKAVTLVNKDGNNYYTEATDKQYTIGSSALRGLGSINGLTADMISSMSETEFAKFKTTYSSDSYLKTLEQDQIVDLLKQETYYQSMLNETVSGSASSGDAWHVRYIKDSTSGSYVPYFYKSAEVTNEGNYTDGYATVDCYSLGSTTKTKEVINELGKVEKDSSGRYISITLYETDENGDIKDNTAKEYSLTTNTSTDEEAYNDALNQYNYDQAQYDKAIQDINSKLEIVQQQDKKLELNLKQLDTEENAISTEMDAVKKVISKNVESSFKTFNA